MVGEDGVVGVNVSSSDLLGAALVQDVADALSATGCPPGRLSLELGEWLVCSTAPLVRRTLAGLHSLGVGLVIDHVSGEVSASTLAALPVQGIKLDRGLVAGDTGGGRGQPAFDARQAVVHSLVALAADLGLEVSAVGVETAAQQQWLVENGVLLGQGWRLGPPAPWVTVRRRHGSAELGDQAICRRADR